MKALSLVKHLDNERFYSGKFCLTLPLLSACFPLSSACFPLSSACFPLLSACLPLFLGKPVLFLRRVIFSCLNRLPRSRRGVLLFRARRPDRRRGVRCKRPRPFSGSNVWSVYRRFGCRHLPRRFVQFLYNEALR